MKNGSSLLSNAINGWIIAHRGEGLYWFVLCSRWARPVSVATASCPFGAPAAFSATAFFAVKQSLLVRLTRCNRAC